MLAKWRRGCVCWLKPWRRCRPAGKSDMLAETYRLQGELLLRQTVPDATQAEACFQQALAITHRQQAKSWELRVATSLACLYQRQGKRTKAHALLAPVYGWFTEGFDTADLPGEGTAGCSGVTARQWIRPYSPTMRGACSYHLECAVLSWDISRQCPCMLAEIMYRRSQTTLPSCLRTMSGNGVPWIPVQR